MKRIYIFLIFVLVVIGLTAKGAVVSSYTLKTDKIQITINEKGALTALKNLTTGVNYAGNGYLWRLYYDSPLQKEIQILASEQTPRITQKGDVITLSYDHVVLNGKQVAISATFEIKLDGDLIRFNSKLKNDEPHTIIRELHYPLVADLSLPADQKLLITDTGGQVYSDPKETIMRHSNVQPYKTPAQLFRQMDIKYPTRIAANCFAFFSPTEGLYFGSHDATFQDTWHGLRLYPDAAGEFTRLEAGIYKYPQCFSGEEWSCNANVIAPYTGTWHETSRFYRQWANTWWEHRETPMWVKKMRSWQRVIFRHQYGEILFKYTDLPGRIKNVGESVGADAAFTFGWWQSGMDNGNPNYVADTTQGGDAGWKKAIAEFKKDGGKVLLYFNGKLIDRESDFYKNGVGKQICYRDNTGAEFTEQYKFTGQGTFLGEYNARTFVIADTRNEVWRKMLLEWADRARLYGANSVFYDQLGYGERSTNWDRSREYAVPNLRVIADKAAALKMVRDHNAQYDPEFALGTEWLTDATAQYCDYIHIYTTTAGPNSFIDWFRYTFPEVIISDREIRDDSDIERRVNNTVLKGLRNDIEIYRCRDLIDKTPHYQAYLSKINAIKGKYGDLLMAGTYRDTDGFSSSNEKIDARAYTQANGMAIVLTQTQKVAQNLSTKLQVPGYRYVECQTAGEAQVGNRGTEVTLGQYGLAVLVFEKEK